MNCYRKLIKLSTFVDLVVVKYWPEQFTWIAVSLFLLPLVTTAIKEKNVCLYEHFTSITHHWGVKLARKWANFRVVILNYSMACNWLFVTHPNLFVNRRISNFISKIPLQEVNSRRSPMQRELRLLITYLSYRNLLYIVFKIRFNRCPLVTGEMEIKQIFHLIIHSQSEYGSRCGWVLLFLSLTILFLDQGDELF